ncbi:MAG: hypothetical protein OXG46_01580 [Chloroflexi bacterium]|nr:hypothetical protein [Chloroflexota bacterium]MCY3939135.1 hypothetical protein [Chloroflexota bacterium]
MRHWVRADINRRIHYHRYANTVTLPYANTISDDNANTASNCDADSNTNTVSDSDTSAVTHPHADAASNRYANTVPNRDTDANADSRTLRSLQHDHASRTHGLHLVGMERWRQRVRVTRY